MENSFRSRFSRIRKLIKEDYEYTEGSAPQSAGEIAITPAIYEQTGAKIGDTVIIDFGTEKIL